MKKVMLKNKQYHAKTLSITTFSTGLLLASGLSYMTISSSVSAESTDFSVEIQQALSITVPESAALELKPNTNNGFGSTTASITVSTNNPTGYTLSVNASSINLTDIQSHTIPTLGTGTFTETTFPANKWGLSIANNNNYIAASTEDILVKQTESSSSSDTNTIGLAAKIDMSQPIGTYVTTLNFTVIANEPPCEGTKLGGVCVTYLQDFYENTSTIAAAMTEGQVYTFEDERDDEVYNVKKLKDGKVWLAENLRLGGSEAINLTPEDTNIVSNWTLPASGTTGFTTGSSNTYIKAAVNADYKDTIQSAMGSSPAGKIGNYYNYCAASAGTYCYAEGSGTGNAEYDICPKGWRMPTGGDNGEYGALYAIYSSNYFNFYTALVVPRSGRFEDGAAKSQGAQGEFWSSTYYNGSRIYYLRVDGSGAFSAYSNYRGDGISVRCVAQ